MRPSSGRGVWLPAGLLAACSAGGGGRIDREPRVPSVHPGFALRVIEGSRVEAAGDTLHVDAPDGSRWFDVQWIPAATPEDTLLQDWGRANCEGALWDRPATPVPSTFTVGGTCRIAERNYWVVAVHETHGDRALMTFYVAAADHLTLEDVWVDLANTALSLSSTALPAPSLDIRAIARQAAAEPIPDAVPRPGSGELSARISERLVPLWEARARASLPDRFDP